MTERPATSTVPSRPTVADARLRELLAARWGVPGELVPLPSERDQNRRVDVDGRPRYVLKVANPAEAGSFLEAQDAVLDRLGSAGLPVPHLVPPLDGRAVHEASGTGASRVRLFTWLDGRPVASLPARPAGLPRAIGELMGGVTVALSGFEHPGVDRPFQWNVLDGVATIERGLPHVADPRRHALLTRRLEELQASRAAIAALPRSVLHGDANDHNLLVDDAGRISGLLDLGDIVVGPTAAEVAVAAAYAMFGATDPGRVAGELVTAYLAVVGLTLAERRLIPVLIRARAAISVAISAFQGSLDPDPYLRISEEPAWRLLEGLDRHDGRG